jgi:hypothetical protein
MRIRHAIAAGGAGLTAAFLVASCGIDTGSSGTPTAKQPVGTGTTATATVRQNAPALPAAPENTVRVDGLASGISDDAAAKFLSASTADVALIHATDERSFADLCAGTTDVVEVSRLPTEAEVAACRNRGVELSQALQVGADAEVIATKNEADVGGDCVTVQQARDIFKAGSPYTSWAQLGFDDLPLTATGREDGSPNFAFFGQVVLGLDNASLADVRADYVAERTDELERIEISGTKRVAAAQRRVAAYRASLVAKTQKARDREVNAAVTAADRKVLRQIDAENRRLQGSGLTLTAVQAARLEARNRLRDSRAKRLAEARIDRRYDADINDRVRRYSRGVLAEARAPGVVGGFRFSYYELFEDKLRPLEIDYGVPVTAGGEPVTLDDLTEADRRRLQSIPTATAQTVPGVGPAATQTTPEGEITTVPTAKAIPDLPARLLPRKTKDGEAIYPGPNCVFPSQVTITNGSYPFSRRLYVYSSYQSLGREEVRAYVASVLDNAQALARANRLVAITDAQLAQEQAILANRGRTPPPVTATQPTTTTRTVTTPQGTTTVQTVTTPAPATTPTSTTPTTESSGIPGVSSRAG